MYRPFLFLFVSLIKQYLNMKNIIKLEELGMFALSILLFNILGYSWWLYLLLILTPDISMLGYLVSPKVGSVTYNLVHHKGVAVLLYLIGVYTYNSIFLIAGIILFGHSSLDRVLGYGLKFGDAFKHTHLGVLGKES